MEGGRALSRAARLALVGSLLTALALVLARTAWACDGAALLPEGGVGFTGYFAGPRVHVLDSYALAG